MEQKPGLISTALLATTAWYSRNSPIQKGKAPLQQALLKLLSPIDLSTEAKGAGQFLLRFPEDHGWEALYFEGTFETGTSELLKRLLRPDDIVLDIGANIGWYTVLISKRVPQGSCHAFEPQPPIFQRLQRVCSLNSLEKTVTLNQLALGEREGKVDLYSFKHLGSGHASLSPLGRSDYTTVSVPLVTLDSYLTSHRIPKVDLIKIDVEGAELSVLRGAQKLLQAALPPIWILEMNLVTAKDFGYSPTDLLRFLQQHGNYRFFRVVHGWGKTLAMKSLDDYEHADNVVCVPTARLPRVNFLDSIPS